MFYFTLITLNHSLLNEDNPTEKFSSYGNRIWEPKWYIYIIYIFTSIVHKLLIWMTLLPWESWRCYLVFELRIDLAPPYIEWTYIWWSLYGMNPDLLGYVITMIDDQQQITRQGLANKSMINMACWISIKHHTLGWWSSLNKISKAI